MDSVRDRSDAPLHPWLRVRAKCPTPTTLRANLAPREKAVKRDMSSLPRAVRRYGGSTAASLCLAAALGSAKGLAY